MRGASASSFVTSVPGNEGGLSNGAGVVKYTATVRRRLTSGPITMSWRFAISREAQVAVRPPSLSTGLYRYPNCSYLNQEIPRPPAANVVHAWSNRFAGDGGVATGRI